jgi:hypothetical protein
MLGDHVVRLREAGLVALEPGRDCDPTTPRTRAPSS